MEERPPVSADLIAHVKSTRQREYGLRVARMSARGEVSGSKTNKLFHHRQLIDPEINETWLLHRNVRTRTRALSWLPTLYGSTVSGEEKSSCVVCDRSWQKKEQFKLKITETKKKARERTNQKSFCGWTGQIKSRWGKERRKVNRKIHSDHVSVCCLLRRLFGFGRVYSSWRCFRARDSLCA